LELVGSWNDREVRTAVAVTAKVKVSSRTVMDDEVQLGFMADYDDGRNREWAKFTPGMSITTRMKKEVAEYFQLGDSFVLSFEKETAETEGGQ
jgi:hypothetical protein